MSLTRTSARGASGSGTALPPFCAPGVTELRISNGFSCLSQGRSPTPERGRTNFTLAHQQREDHM